METSGNGVPHVPVPLHPNFSMNETFLSYAVADVIMGIMTTSMKCLYNGNVSRRDRPITEHLNYQHQ